MINLQNMTEFQTESYNAIEEAKKTYNTRKSMTQQNAAVADDVKILLEQYLEDGGFE